MDIFRPKKILKSINAFTLFLNLSKHFHCVYIFSPNGFQYFCHCDEKCSEHNATLCVVSKAKRSSCRYCRLWRCREAGLREKYVLSSEYTDSETGDASCLNQKGTQNTNININDSCKNDNECQMSQREMFYHMNKKFHPNFLIDSEVIQTKSC